LIIGIVGVPGVDDMALLNWETEIYTQSSIGDNRQTVVKKSVFTNHKVTINLLVKKSSALGE